MKIAVYAGKGREEKGRALEVPSILGMDFLGGKKLRLFIDAEEKTGYLETKDRTE